MPISNVYNLELKSYKCTSINGKGVRLHRVIMENHLGRKLLPTELIHHKDGNKWNNDINNLELTDRSTHAKLHSDRLRTRPRNGKIVTCTVCGQERYYPAFTCGQLTTLNNYKCRKCFEQYGKSRPN